MCQMIFPAGLHTQPPPKNQQKRTWDKYGNQKCGEQKLQIVVPPPYNTQESSKDLCFEIFFGASFTITMALRRKSEPVTTSTPTIVLTPTGKRS